MTLPLAFIHIGMGKCASTYLQSVWSKDERYTSLSLHPVATQLRTVVEQGSQSPITINTGPINANGRTVIATSEGLSWGWLNEPDDHDKLFQYQSLAALSLARARLSDTILIVVRNPVDWLRALHEQYIKQGGWENFQTFLEESETLIRSLFDLEALYKIYEEHFERVVIFSSDHLRQDPEGFWKNYRSVLGPKPPSLSARKAVEAQPFSGNKSLGARVEALACINKTMLALNDIYEGLDEIPDFIRQERVKIAQMFKESSRWLSRRTTEFADDDALQALINTLGHESQDGFAKITISEDLRDHIQSRFLNTLKDKASFEVSLIEAYETALGQHTVSGAEKKLAS